jgi:peroxiredoxin
MAIATVGARPPLRPGEPAPAFSLPLVSDVGTASLEDYAGRTPVLLVLLRYLWCPFCRRHITQLGGTRAKLEAAGVEVLGIIEDAVEPARRYFAFRPAKVRLATDPDRTVHRAFGLIMPVYAGAYNQLREATLVNPTGELPEPMPIPASMKRLNDMEGFDDLPEVKGLMATFAKRDFGMHAGHFLLDRSGIVRWAWVECPSPEDVTQYGRLPTDNEILAAVRAAGL